MTSQSRAPRAAWWLIAAAALLVPIVFDLRGNDAFRVPKELVFRAIAIGLLIVCGVTLTSAAWPRWRSMLRRPPALVALAVLVWTAVTTAFSTNVILSTDSFITVAAAVVIFIGTGVALSYGTTLQLLDIILIPALVNAALAVAQELRIWQPFTMPDDVPHHMRTIALLGNPNDVGMYLVLPAVAAVIAAVMTSGRRRHWYIAAGVGLAIGVVVSGSRGALAAYGAGVIAAAAVSFRRVAVNAVASLVLVLGLAACGGEAGLLERARAGGYEKLFSQRMPAFLAAKDMFLDRPITGAGPGVFKFQYMAYRLEQPGRYSDELIAASPLNFREVHNDHLQILAETGAVGFAVFIAALATILRRRPDDPFGLALRIPLVISVIILMMWQFPLQLAAPRLMIILFAAIATGGGEA